MSAIASSSSHQVTTFANNTLASPGQYLTFMLGGEVYALGILNIKEIIDYDDVTEVPMMPPSVRGVINLRGSVVPVIDLMTYFGRDKITINQRTGIVIVEIQNSSDAVQHDIGIMVDSVNEVLEIGQQDIEPPPSFGCAIRQDFISGMAKCNGKFIILLNLDQVLSVEEIVRQTGGGNGGAKG